MNKIKKECQRINPKIDYSSNDWEKEFIDNVNWKDISWKQNLSEEFIEYFKEYVNWVYISSDQELSEQFIEKHKKYVDWYNISRYKKLSESFIEKHKDKINFNSLFENINITNELILNNINWFINININKDSWRFKDEEFKDKFYKYKKIFSK